MPSDNEPVLSPQQLADRSVERMEALTKELHDTMFSHLTATFSQCESASDRTVLAINDMQNHVDQLYKKLDHTLQQLETSVDTMVADAIQRAKSHISASHPVAPASITASCIPSATNCTPATVARSSRAPSSRAASSHAPTE